MRLAQLPEGPRLTFWNGNHLSCGVVVDHIHSEIIHGRLRRGHGTSTLTHYRPFGQAFAKISQIQIHLARIGLCLLFLNLIRSQFFLLSLKKFRYQHSMPVTWLQIMSSTSSSRCQKQQHSKTENHSWKHHWQNCLYRSPTSNEFPFARLPHAVHPRQPQQRSEMTE